MRSISVTALSRQKTGGDETVEVDAAILHQTEKAYLFDTGRLDIEGKPVGVWVSKSKARHVSGDLYEMPQWIAKKEGLI